MMSGKTLNDVDAKNDENSNNPDFNCRILLRLLFLVNLLSMQMFL
jgi:hypothetical protein